MERLMTYCCTTPSSLMNNSDDNDHHHGQLLNFNYSNNISFINDQSYDDIATNNMILNFSNDNNNNNEDNDIYDNSGDNSLGNLAKDYDQNLCIEQINTLLSKCQQYQAIIKRQENEIDYYRKHIESLEDDHSRIYSSLAAAEKKLKEYEKKLLNYEQTIDSLENELEHMHSKLSISSSSSSKIYPSSSAHDISLTNEFNFQIYKDHSSSANRKYNKNNINNQDFDQLLSSFAQIDDENNRLKLKIDAIIKENERLKKDNEDYCLSLTHNCTSSTSQSNINQNHQQTNQIDHHRMSTPIKNFISYKALNVPVNNSFSIDEDYECGDNLMLIYDNLKQIDEDKSIDNQLKPKQNFIDESMKYPSIDLIENEEMPSRMIRGDDLSTIIGEKLIEKIPSNNYDETFTTLSTCEISHICDEKSANIDGMQKQIESNTVETVESDFNGNYQTFIENDNFNKEIDENQAKNQNENFVAKLAIFFDLKQFIALYLLSIYLIFEENMSKLKSISLISIIISIIFILSMISMMNLLTSNQELFNEQKLIETRLIPFYSFEELSIELFNKILDSSK